MPLRHYHNAGLSVASEIELPEWEPFARQECLRAPKVVIRSRISDDAERDGEAESHISTEEFRFRVQDVGRFRVRREGTIDVAAVPTADPGAIRAIVLGWAWTAVCYFRGMLLLHAGVVDFADLLPYADAATRLNAGVAFCGPSGAGKSTLSVWLAHQGARLLSDDLCHVEMRGDRCLAHPSSMRVKLWSDAVDALGCHAAIIERDQRRSEKYHVSQPGANGPDPGDRFLPAGLGAICLLSWGDDLCLTRLSGMDALRRLIATGTFRGDLLEPMGRLADHWNALAALVARVPVWDLVRARDLGSMTATATRLSETLFPLD